MPDAARHANRLLAALPDDEWTRLRSGAQTIPLVLGEVLCEQDTPTTAVYFPTTGAISAVTVTNEGGSVEGILAGPEGAVGIAAAAGYLRTPWRLTVQAAGAALLVKPDALEAALPLSPVLQRVLFRYSHATQQLATQSIACNRFHALPERTARWLLMILDRVGGSEVHITQEFLAQMLGTHRPSTTVALAALDQAGLIVRAGRGRIQVPDRAALQAAACECYQRVVDEMNASALSPYAGGATPHRTLVAAPRT